MKKTLLTGLAILLMSVHIFAQNAKDSLTLKLDKIAKESEISGFSIAVVSKDSILYKHGFGYADIEKEIPFTENTILNIGSITKTLIGVSLMKLVDNGKISLDDPINNYLPFKVENPFHPENQITIRQLATHTSSLTDGKDDMLIERSYVFNGPIDFKEEELPKDYFSYFQIYKSNKLISMGQFLKNAYSKTGLWFEKENFSDKMPGTEYNYTNLGATVLAYIIEQISGMPFNEFTNTEIFEPLKMEHSYWSLDDVPKDKIASLYMSNGLLIPHYSLITYPDGGLFTNVSDFSLYLMDMIKGLNSEGILLNNTSYKQMMSNQLTKVNFPNSDFELSRGLMWRVNKEGDNITMNGSDPGIVTYTLFTTQGNVGMVIFINQNFYGNETLEQDFKNIRSTLFQNIGSLLKNK